MKLLNRYKGALVGVHVGDSLGAPYEKMFSAKQIAEDIKKRDGLCMFNYRNPWPKDDNGDYLPAGRPTDDSDQTADLAYSLIECAGLNTDHLREALRDSVVRGKSRLWDGQATGAGGTTKKALSDDSEEVKEGLANTIATNGGLMRSTPMALWLCEAIWPEYPKRNSLHLAPLEKYVREMAAVTHAHPVSKKACWIYTVALSALLHGGGFDNLLGGMLGLDSGLRSNPLFNRLMWSLGDKDIFPVDPGDWPARGTAEFSLYVALYALMNTKSFEEGIELAVRVGGDTDTYAAIAGGLLGAYYGYDAIPKEWRETILGHDVMVDYAQKLYDMRLYK